jgi:glucose-6-phosphate dehydrogenase assembly protein OpcA
MVSHSFESDFQDLPHAKNGELKIGNGVGNGNGVTLNSSKACLFNLIVVSHTIESSLASQELIKLISERFPCRAIFVLLSSDVAAGVRTSKRVELFGSEENSIACDQIYIEAHEAQSEQVPFALLPNIIPDLPIYLLTSVFSLDIPIWKDVLFKSIKPFINRFIFKADTICSLNTFAQSIRTLLFEQQISTVDIAWAQSKGWREVLTRVFYDEQKLESLRAAKRIQLSYSKSYQSNTSFIPLQPLYIQSWLASRLQWQLQSVKEDLTHPKIYYTVPGGGTLEVVIGPLDKEFIPQGAICSIEVESAYDAHYLLTHDRDAKHVKVHASDAAHCEMPYSVFMTNYQRGASLITELFYRPLSPHYLEMLAQFESDLWRNESM